MSKKPRPTVVEKIQAKQTQPRLDLADIGNLMAAARFGLQHLRGEDLVNVSLSIARIEAALQAAQPKQPEPPAQQEAANG